MPTTRKSYAPNLKAKISVEAIKAQKTTTELAQLYHVNPNLIAKWKKQAFSGSSGNLPSASFRRPHQSLDYCTPAELYLNSRPKNKIR
jgi:transposase-like protein